MQDHIFSDIPVQYKNIEAATKKLPFNMASDLFTGSLLKTLIASKQAGRILELGTGSGLATSWILRGMDRNARLTTVENNPVLLEIAKTQLEDVRIDFVLADGYQWLQNYRGTRFDLIFADAMPGKYELFEQAMSMLKTGGFYVIDDMAPQTNWCDGHAQRVADFISMMEKRTDITLTKLNWSTGIIIATKIFDKK